MILTNTGVPEVTVGDLVFPSSHRHFVSARIKTKMQTSKSSRDFVSNNLELRLYGSNKIYQKWHSSIQLINLNTPQGVHFI